MVKRIGRKRKVRTRLMVSKRLKGKIIVHRYIQTFEEGDKVLLKATPQVMKGLYFMRYHGRIGEIKGKRGKCYEVAIRNGGKQKTLVIRPIHLRKA